MGDTKKLVVDIPSLIRASQAQARGPEYHLANQLPPGAMRPQRLENQFLTPAESLSRPLANLPMPPSKDELLTGLLNKLYNVQTPTPVSPTPQPGDIKADALKQISSPVASPGNEFDQELADREDLKKKLSGQ